MKTKFIGLDGFGEIEAVSKKKTTKKTKNLSTAQKSVRFARTSRQKALLKPIIRKRLSESPPVCRAAFWKSSTSRADALP